MKHYYLSFILTPKREDEQLILTTQSTTQNSPANTDGYANKFHTKASRTHWTKANSQISGPLVESDLL